MIRAALFSALIALTPVAGFADAALTRLADVLGIDAYIAITRSEGLGEVDALSTDMLGQPATSALTQQMTKVYDPTRMQDTVLRILERDLSSDQIAASLIFFDSVPGMRITELEIAARKAMSQSDVEDAARQAWMQAEEAYPWLVARIGEMTAINDLIERNVSGALNSNFRFYQGLADGGGLEMSEADMLAEVWGQEQEIRADTEVWVGAYLLLAYQPLSEVDLTDYLAFWETDAGRAVNAALFSSFNTMYDDISYATGRVLALNMGGQDL